MKIKSVGKVKKSDSRKAYLSLLRSARLNYCGYDNIKYGKHLKVLDKYFEVRGW